MAEDIISVVFNRLQYDKEKLECNGFEKIEVDAFNLNDFWTQFGASVQALSNEVTKIGFLCGSEPFPKKSDLESMLQDMVQYYNMMRDLYLVLPEEVGKEVFKAVTDSVLRILSTLLNFVESLNDLSEKGAKERLTLTGSLWDACTAVELLPKNNLQATLTALDGEIALAADAQEELSMVNNTDHEITTTTHSLIDTMPPKMGEVEIEEKDKSNLCDKELLNKTDKNEQEERVNISAFELSPEVKEQQYTLSSDDITEVDYDNLKKWATLQISWNKPASSKTLQIEIDGVSNLLQRLAKNPNDAIFTNLSEVQKMDKHESLKKKLLDLLRLKHLTDAKPESLSTVLSEITKVSSYEEHEEKDTTKGKLIVNDKEGIPLKTVPVLLNKSTDQQQNTSNEQKWSMLNLQQPVDSQITLSRYLDLKSWIQHQLASHKPATSAALEVEIDKHTSIFQNSINNTNNTQVRSARRSHNRRKSKLMKKIRQLREMKHILDTYPSLLLDSMPNSQIISNFRQPQLFGNVLGMNGPKEILNRGATNVDNTVVTTSSTSRQSICETQTVNINVRVSNTRSWKNDSFNKRNSNLQMNKNEGRQLKYCKFDTYPEHNPNNSLLGGKIGSSSEFSFSYNTSDVQKEIGESSLHNRQMSWPYNEKRKFETLHVVLPTPSTNCSSEFAQYYPHLQASEVLTNIAKRNPGLNAECWHVYREWRDEQNQFNLHIGVDERSLKVLQSQDYKARVTFQYYAYFGKP